MELPLPPDLNKPLEPRTPAAVSSPYPVAYFLCDKLVDAKVLKAKLELERAPKLRRARIVGYKRAECEQESTVQYDGTNFGEWCGEEIVKGVVFEALNGIEEAKLMEYVGVEGGIKEVELEVQCPNMLGKVGKMTTVHGRIFVPAGEGDTLVGSGGEATSGNTVPGGADYFDLVVQPGGRPRASAQVEDNEDDELEDSSTVTGSHPTPRLSPAILTLSEEDIPHQPLEPLPFSSVAAEPRAQDEDIETKSMNSTEEFLYLERMRDREEMSIAMIVEEEKEKKNVYVEEKEVRKTSKFSYHTAVRRINGLDGSLESPSAADLPDIEKLSQEGKEGPAPEVHPGILVAAVLEINEEKETSAPATPVRKMGLEDKQAPSVETQPLTPVAAIREMNHEGEQVPAPESQPWTPTVPWKKENAVAPVRPTLHSEISSKETGSIRSRKTSESIQSIVDKFESLSPQKTTPNSTPKKRA